MQAFPFTALITLAAVAVFFWTATRVAGARSRYKVPVPATTGDPDFERYFRVQMNMLEWMPIFLPALWLCAGFWGDKIAAGVGAVWVLARIFYALAYVRDPKSRGVWFLAQTLASLALWVGGVAGVVQILGATIFA